MTTTDSITESLAAIERLRHWCVSGEARKIRVSAHLTGLQLANLAGVSPAGVSCWERGVRRPHGESALRYFQTLTELREPYGEFADGEFADAS